MLTQFLAKVIVDVVVKTKLSSVGFSFLPPDCTFGRDMQREQKTFATYI